MTTDQIDKAMKARPFKPFTLYIADGTSVSVAHPELLWRTPQGRTIYVVTDPKADAAEIIDLLLVTRLKFDNAKTKQNGKH